MTCTLQKEASASTAEAADILPQLPARLRQDVLWVTMNPTIQGIRFLKVPARVCVELDMCIECGVWVLVVTLTLTRMCSLAVRV